MIQNIDIKKISPHYDNPRKELGDLTELADSIKNNGIFQNLTVVPWFSKITGVGADDPKQQEEMGYIVVIGHRRLAAAKLAGLTEVPCCISNMSYRKQIATMLLENMQRSDLTIYEQAQGFQMMLDLGETINEITQNTGFSESTIRRRIKLLELDKEKFKESVERGATLMDYAELDKLQDIELRNKVLDKVGTPNFKWELQSAIATERNKKSEARIIAELEKFATKVEDASDLQSVTSYYPSQAPEISIPNDAEEYFYKISSWGIGLYKKPDNDKPTRSDPAWLEKQRIQDEKRTALEVISKRAYQFRFDFIKAMSNASAKKNMSIIAQYLLWAVFDNELDYEEFAQFFEIEIVDDADDGYEGVINSILKQIPDQPERALLAAAYLMSDSAHWRYYTWDNQHKENKELDTIYDFIVKLGYQISEEEQALRDGTHELFTVEDI